MTRALYSPVAIALIAALVAAPVLAGNMSFDLPRLNWPAEAAAPALPATTTSTASGR